ncbi:MAG: F0F1 ATP synthase subunit B [Planctomycetota bacterium]|nr:F0F1 ATP synthase subunit B [Planctomycetota bacterium]
MKIPVSFAMLAVLAPVAFGADDAHHAPLQAVPSPNQGLVTAITAVVVFVIVAAVLHVKVWPVIAGALDARSNKIREEIEAAEMARQQAKDALEQYQQSLAQARAEAQKMIEQARQQQTALAASLKAQADAELTAMRDRARKDIEAAKRAAVAEVYAEASNLGAMIAGKILKRQVTPADTQALVEESVTQLAASRN